MMSEDLKAIFSQFRRLDAMAQVAGGRINYYQTDDSTADRFAKDKGKLSERLLEIVL